MRIIAEKRLFLKYAHWRFIGERQIKMTKKIIEIKDIGFVHFYKNKNAKNLKIILKPNRPPRVTVPFRIPFKTAEDFLHSKTHWLKENLEKIKQIENKKRTFDENTIETLRFEAKKILPDRVKELSQKHNLIYKKVFIKNLKSRWGSCSADNNINLNLHIMRLPEKLIDYIILHELAHTKEKNHGKGFWNLLNTLILGARILDKELKQHSIYF